jgi:hypothetical protein
VLLSFGVFFYYISQVFNQRVLFVVPSSFTTFHEWSRRVIQVITRAINENFDPSRDSNGKNKDDDEDKDGCDRDKDDNEGKNGCNDGDVCVNKTGGSLSSLTLPSANCGNSVKREKDETEQHTKVKTHFFLIYICFVPITFFFVFFFFYLGCKCYQHIIRDYSTPHDASFHRGAAGHPVHCLSQGC